jgi:hypothetical protein
MGFGESFFIFNLKKRFVGTEKTLTFYRFVNVFVFESKERKKERKMF